MDQTKIQELENKLDSIKKELKELKAQPTELVRSWEEAIISNGAGYWFDELNGIRGCTILNADMNKKAFRLAAQAKSALAFAQLSHIVADANGDWVADWGNLKQSKYIVEAVSNILIKQTYQQTTQHLPMKSAEIRDACLEKHRTLWEDFWMVSK